MSQFDQYRSELQQLGLTTREDLVNLVKPLIRTSTKMITGKAMRPPAHSQQLSHFGGQPYFEKGESWPEMPNGRPMDFIFQVVNTGQQGLPEDIKVLQFYYDWHAGPWSTGDGGWLVKTYEAVNPDKQLLIERPANLGRAKYCDITFKQIQVLPDWDGIDDVSPEASKLSCTLDENEPWTPYQEVTKELGAEPDFQSLIGGYPKWLQGNDGPVDDDNQALPLLFQVDSDVNADITWSDQGLVYVFYNPARKGEYKFILQSL